MSSIAPCLDKKPNSSNLHSIRIRVIIDRKPSYSGIGQRIPLNDWDFKNRRVKNSHPDSLYINQLIINKLSKFNQELISADLRDEYSTSQNVKSAVVSKQINEFFEISKIYLDKLEDSKKIHQLEDEKFRVNFFKEFLKKDKLYFNEISVQMIRNFGTYILNERRVKGRTVANYMITIRTIFNLAIEKYKIDDSFYPFGKGKYQIKFPETKKIGLNSSEIIILENLGGLSDAQVYALNAWLLSFYFAGIRCSDLLLLKWKDFSDDRLHYRMTKNSKLVSLKVPVKARKLLNDFKELQGHSDCKYVLNNLQGVNVNNPKILRTRVKTVNRNFNRRLEIVAEKAGIDKKLTMHIARHSFGQISGNKISIQLLQKLYRHSSITTTILYQSNFIKSDIDEALDKVVNFN